MVLNVDFLIVISYLVLTLWVGSGYGKEVKTIKDYALGGRKFSTTALVSTITATYASGSGFFSTLSQIYFEGFYYLVSSSFISVSMLIVAFVFVPRMGKFLGVTSVAEALGSFYGKEVRIITAVCGAVASTGIISVQFNAFGNIVGYFSGISSSVAIVIAGTLVTFYSAFGGIRAVTFTDVLQLLTFCFALPLMGIMIWNQIYATEFSISSVLQVPKFDMSYVLNLGNPKTWDMIPIIFFFAMPSIRSVDFQRIAMGTSIRQVKKAWIISATLLMAVKMVLVWIPFLVFCVQPNLEQQDLFGFIIDNYTYSGLKWILIVGIIALAMSTADSVINTSSVLFANDICKPLKIGVNRELLFARAFSSLLGTASVVLALTGKNLLAMILAANMFYMPVVTPPLLLTILGFRTTTRVVLIGMVGGFGVAISCKLFSMSYDPIMFAMLANVIFLLSSHYILKQDGGWVGVQDPEYLEEQARKKTARRDQIKRIKSILKNPDLWGVLKKYAPSNSFTYMGFGIYCIVCTITTMYTTQAELKGQNSDMILGIYQLMIVIGTAMLSYPVWPLSIKEKYKKTAISLMWFPSVFLMLGLFSAFFAMVSGFAHLQFVIFSINTMLTILLVGWKSAFVMIGFGFYFAVELFKYHSGIEHFSVPLGSPEFVLMYSILLLATVVLIFLKPKEESIALTKRQVGILNKEVGSLEQQVKYYDERLNDTQREADRLGVVAQKILNNVNHELRLPIGNVVNFAEMMKEMLAKSDRKYLEEVSNQIYENSNNLSAMILNMLDLAMLNVQNIELRKKDINLTKLVNERIKVCSNLYIQGKDIEFELSIEDGIVFFVDADYIRQMVDNLVVNAINFSEKGGIKVVLSKQDEEILLTVEDQGIGIPEAEIYDIFTPFKMASNTDSKAKGRGVGLSLCKAVAKSHGGEITVKSDANGTIFTVFLPILDKG